MNIDSLQIAYDIVSKFTKYDTQSKPPRINRIDYEVPRIKGIHKGDWGKNIEEVYPNTLEYILYYLHNNDEGRVIDTLIALLYYWKFRKRKQAKMDEVYQEIIKHYTVENIAYNDTYTGKDKCVYLVKIYIGSKVLYKVGKTEDIHQRMINLQSDIKNSYPLVSVGLSILAVKLCDNSAELEEIILSVARSKIAIKHKFYFKGSSEAFESINLIDIFTQYIT